MTVLLICAGIYGILWLLGKAKASGSVPPQGRAAPPPPPAPPPQARTSYRPQARPSRSSAIRFTELGADTPATLSAGSLDGLRDAFTGAILDPALGLFRCTSCQVYYHRESYEVVRSENAGQCVACSSTAIVQVAGKTAPGRNFDPDVVTLADFRQHFGRVVTFEAQVRAVRQSRRGTDYAVFFELKPWRSAFKLVFFRRAVGKVGGPQFVESLEGRTVRVRGLLIDHAQYGPEIIISERSMILAVK